MDGDWGQKKKKGVERPGARGSTSRGSVGTRQAGKVKWGELRKVGPATKFRGHGVLSEVV